MSMMVVKWLYALVLVEDNKGQLTIFKCQWLNDSDCKW